MATKIGPKTVTQRDRSKNLVFCIDAANSRSYGGQVAANIFVDPNNFGGAEWNQKNGTWAAYDDPGPHGNGCYSCTATDSDPYGYSNEVRSVGTGNVTFSVWVKGVGGTVGMGGDVRINFGSGGGSASGTNTTVTYTISENWQKVSVTQNVTGAGTIKVGLETPNGATAGQVVLVSDPQLEQGSTSTPFTATNRRSGTVSGEILADGGFETWSNSTTLSNWTSYIAGSSSLNQDSSNEESGTYCARLDIDASDNNALIYTSAACFAPGKRYRVTFSAKCSSGTCTASVYESNGATVPSYGLGENLALTTSYQSFSFDFKALGYNGANQYLLFGRKLGGGGDSKSLYFDNASVVELGATAVTNISGANSENTALTGTFATYGQELFRPTTRNVLATFDSKKGHAGGAYWDFDGSDECIVIPYADDSSLDLARGTIISWFKASGGGHNGVIVGWGSAGTDNYGNIAITSNWTGGYADESLAYNRYKGSASNIQMYIRKGHNFYADSTWHCVAVTSHGGASDLGNIYIDGELQTITTTSSIGDEHPFMNIKDSTTKYLNIGRRPYNSGAEFFNGEIANTMIWSSSLTSKEIKDIYIAQKGRFGK